MSNPFDCMTFKSWDRKPIVEGSRISCPSIDFGKVTMHSFNENYAVLRVHGGTYWSGRMAHYGAAYMMTVRILGWGLERDSFTCERLIEFPSRKKKVAA